MSSENRVAVLENSLSNFGNLIEPTALLRWLRSKQHTFHSLSKSKPLTHTSHTNLSTEPVLNLEAIIISHPCLSGDTVNVALGD